MLLKELDEILMQVQKPSRYIGGELGSVVKTPHESMFRFGFCFPDLYEIGMSHLGMKILYGLQNAQNDIWCERVFAPDIDMEQKMREHAIPLYALESLEPIKNFDMIGFSLQYEMSFPTVLNMLDLAGIPVRSEERTSLFPIIVAGGPCVCNPEPVAKFIDLFMIGEGEEMILELIALHKKAKKEMDTKQQFLIQAAQIEGVYVPSLYDIVYHEDGTIKEVIPKHGAPQKIKRRLIQNMDTVYFPTEFVIPSVPAVHDRAVIEVLRGCFRGCRFCQAGYIYRPFRKKEIATLNKNAKELIISTGYDEVSLSSLSTSDYPDLNGLMKTLMSWTDEDHVNLCLPSLRIDNFSDELLEQVAKVRKSGLTFAPEAGTQRMRDVINKNITEENVMKTCKIAFEGGYINVKLYFMLGLPTETDEDVAGIIHLAQKVVDLFYDLPNRPKGKGVSVTVSVACFVPKPFTPFEFEAQDTKEMLDHKQTVLLNTLRSKKINVKYHDSTTSFWEDVLARGDRKTADIIEEVWKNGGKLESSDQCFQKHRWEDACKKVNIDPAFYANRKREYDEIMPWDHIDYGVTKQFLIAENKRAYENAISPNCKEQCTGCGANKLVGGKCNI